ncbi:MAG: hypothetical protein AMS27_00665 [Bacteroides sp. SM23_62_1]|nr:MAG: hypothetical protein AMS27_00665 [Bacteroides sp. SM23_62_1]
MVRLTTGLNSIHLRRKVRLETRPSLENFTPYHLCNFPHKFLYFIPPEGSSSQKFDYYPGMI